MKLFDKIRNLRKPENLPDFDKALNLQTIEEKPVVLDDKQLFSFVSFDSTKSEHLASQPYSYFKSVLRSFVKRPAAIIGSICMIILILGIIIIPFLLPDPVWIDAARSNLGKNLRPSAQHLFGTDSVGRDLFFAIWISARKSMWIAVVNSIIVLFLGTVFGLIWGFFRKIDWLFVEIYNLITNIPSLLIYMLLSTVFVQSLPFIPVEVRLILSLTLTGWLGLARFLRNQILIISNREYNVASRTLGTPSRRIMTKNLLPYLLAVIITTSMSLIPGMISGEVVLSFFGLGLPTDSVAMGALLNNGIKLFGENVYMLLVPGGALAFIILTFYLIGLALADSLDPRTHR